MDYLWIAIIAAVIVAGFVVVRARGKSGAERRYGGGSAGSGGRTGGRHEPH